jgi:hypothetical protein
MMSSRDKRKNIRRRLIVLLVVGGYIAIFGEYHLSTLIFRYHCSDDSQVGMHIYERVVLDESYFVPVPEDRKSRFRLNSRLVYPDGTMLDAERLSKDYDISKYMERDIVSSIGPVTSRTSSVSRISDGKLMAKAVGYVQVPGWLSTAASADGRWTRVCPERQGSQGQSGYGAIHRNFLREVFQKE